MIKKIEEQEVETQDEKKRVASSVVMNKALEIVSKRFNLDDSFIMIAFKDGANMCQVTLANNEYEVSVKLRKEEGEL